MTGPPGPKRTTCCAFALNGRDDGGVVHDGLKKLRGECERGCEVGIASRANKSRNVMG